MKKIRKIPLQHESRTDVDPSPLSQLRFFIYVPTVENSGFVIEETAKFEFSLVCGMDVMLSDKERAQFSKDSSHTGRHERFDGVI